jgi:RNA ligase (TIGR02306 family)
MRKLATIETITDLSPIDGADKIEVATVKGWKTVVKKNEFKVGEQVVYFEVDSWIPNELAPFLSKDKPKKYNEILGERLKTIRLRGQISQGLVLPLTCLPENIEPVEGLDVSETLNILKWEKEIPANLRGQIKGNFPAFLRKTDSERIQNLWKNFETFVTLSENPGIAVFEKLDGTSCTIYRKESQFGVCSRNLELKLEDNTTYSNFVEGLQIQKLFEENGFDDLAIQLELVGPGIQGNKYNLPNIAGFVFDIFDIKSGVYMDMEEFLKTDILEKLKLPQVPFLGLFKNTELTLENTLKLADGNSVLYPTPREGLVLKPLKESVIGKEQRFSIKVISNEFLLNE